MIIKEGTRIYNRGDMANPDHFGVVVRVKTDNWGTHYEIEKDNIGERYFINKIDSVYTGNGMSRVVVEDEYLRWRKEKYRLFYPDKQE